ncbi:SCO family protein [Salinisphaera orenii]|uniref:Electron transporter SenC n=1 Tax=Salinisphaera orenii YIM 95161 TaxID=1051139 RepID=A0A423PVR2_9GAMM|nr:SCO family protein [Salinisphaera halophila]ROO29612.1 electron transporter SenC [Salinisphaera halophila YIM 95161]
MNHRLPRRLFVVFALAATALLAACSGGEPEYNAHDIEGVMPDLAFNLTDENGNAVEADDYDGRLKLLFFGYTNCPDICPATMARIRAALGGLDDTTRENIDVLFVSVDPERDDPERLAQFTSSFGPRFVGLTGSQEQLKALSKRYRVTYGYGEPNDNGFYLVSHSSAIFVFGPEGKARLLVNQEQSVDALRADLKKLLERVD